MKPMIANYGQPIMTSIEYGNTGNVRDDFEKWQVFLLTDCGTVLIVLSLLQSEPSSTGSRDRRTGDDALTSTQTIMYRDAVHAAYGMEVLS